MSGDLRRDALELEAAAAVILARYPSRLWPSDVATLNAARALANSLATTGERS